jgi:23S rRNA G2445 N2-methylase RlmL
MLSNKSEVLNTKIYINLDKSVQVTKACCQKIFHTMIGVKSVCKDASCEKQTQRKSQRRTIKIIMGKPSLAMRI